MRYNAFVLTMALSLVSTHTSFGQGPVGDEVMVTFDRTVLVGSRSLPAGKYTIRQVTSASNPRVLEFTSNNGTKLDATVAAIPILQNTPPSKTRVVLDDEGGTPRLAKIWVQGKSYGYAFPRKGGTAIAGVNSVGLEGTFKATPPPAPAVAEERTPAPAPVTQSTPPPADNPVVAQNRPAETPAPPPPPPAQPQTTPPPVAETAQNTTKEVPTTALGWMQIALLGMALASAGGLLLWRERVSRS